MVLRCRSLPLTVPALAAWLWLGSAAAQTPAEDGVFKQGTAALERGAFGEAIGQFEALADRGFVHADLSYDRGLAYVGRARSLQGEPGDLGRAAAGFAEALVLRPGDADAEHALEIVRTEIGRRLARGGRAPVMARPSLGRAIVTLLPENVWAAVAALGSLATAIGLALQRFAKRHSAVLGGSVTLGIGLLLLTLGSALTASARHLRHTSVAAIVVVDQARLLDEAGRPLPNGRAETDAIPEGAEVYVTEHRGGLSRVEWGNSEGWVVAGQVRELGPVQP